MKKLTLVLLLTSFIILTGCQKAENQVIIDWVDFIKFDGVEYLSEGYNTNKSGTLTTADLGKKYSEVKFKVADNITTPDYKTKNGDAAYLEPGTEVYQLKGYDPNFRLAIIKADQITIYESFRNPKAKHGSDLLDLFGKVTYIGINSEEDGTTELASIKDMKLVSDLVVMTLEAPVDQVNQQTDGPRYFIDFHLKDGTSVKRAYWIESGYLSTGIMLPKEFNNQVKQALSNQK